ncbi:DNA repair protein RecO [Thermaurantiacus sp.]
MDRHEDALVLTVLPHGEHAAVVRFLAREAGLLAAYVHGARSRRRRGDLAPGNRVRLALRSRVPDQLPTAAIEPLASRALLAFGPATAAALDYLVQLLAGALAEGEACPDLYQRFDALLDLMAAGDDWLAAMIRFERDLLSGLGFGLDLAQCALTGQPADLGFVSPRSGRAVSRTAVANQPWVGRLLPLPAFLVDDGAYATPTDMKAGLELTGHFLARYLFTDLPRAAALRAEAVARLGAMP